jgi:large subunit ribosomal protein L6|tara:strand:+ start:295 stop:729 length:435 start_codon:yes stop_codon:yes gene_type:complete
MEIGIRMEDDVVLVERSSEEPKIRSLHGTTRTLISNMVVGVSDGWEKLLRIEGVGYRAALQGRDLVLSLGFSHPVTVVPPKGIEFEVDDKVRSVTVKGIDKELVGQVAADVRRWRPPEPYKGKGIRYQDEIVRRKAGKAAKVEL